MTDFKTVSANYVINDRNDCQRVFKTSRLTMNKSNNQIGSVNNLDHLLEYQISRQRFMHYVKHNYVSIMDG